MEVLKYFLFMCIIVQIDSGGQNQKRSLAIVFDITNSMSDEINSLRDGVKLLLQSFTSRPDNPISEYIFVQFRDETNEPYIIPTIVETDVTKINQHLDSFRINAGRNYDCLESCFRGIKYGLDESRDNSIMFVFTDAGTKHKEMKSELEKLIQRKRITVYFFITEGCGREDHEIQYYQDLALGSNGLVFDVDYHQIKKHFPQYREVINDKTTIGQVVTGGIGKSIVDVNVDSSMKEFTLTIVTQQPAITIYDPTDKPITDYELLTDLPTIKMIKVKDPEPGKWTIQIITTKPYKGQVAVISELSFKYGFARHEPNSITQTSFSPLIGENNYLAILPSDPTLIRDLEQVVLQTKHEQFRFPLIKKTVAEGDLYITGSIRLPNIPFKVTLHGLDPASHAINRLISPDIEPRLADKPEAGIDSKINVQEGEPIYLICRVDSLVDITISWYKVPQGSALKSMEFKQSNILNHTIAESKLSDAGVYSCVAKNIAGEAESKTMVDVRHTILSVNTPIKQHFHIAGKPGPLVLKCVVIPKMAGVEISWLFNGKPTLPRDTEFNLPNLILKNIDRSFNGTYTCVAKRNSEIQQDIIEVNVQYKAKILNIFNIATFNVISTSKPIEIFDQSIRKISCGSEGNPEPEIKWINQNGDTVSNTSILVVDGKDLKQAGDYACQAENSAGKDEKRIKVVITTKPKLLDTFDTNYLVKLGEEFSLECPIATISNTKLAIVWYHNTSQIQQGSILNDRVKIDKTDHVHNGKYKCEASNKAGTVEAEFNVNVLYQPKILNIVKLDDTGSDILAPSVTKIEIFNITKFSLTCNANGNPPPAITWKKEGIIFSDTNKLYINLAQTGLSGSYTCSIKNELSSDDRVIELVEIGKPKLSPNFKSNHREKLGGQLSLDCPLQVDPKSKPDIVWYHNISRIHPSLVLNDRVKINKLDHVHNGKYRCEASTKAGTVVAEFNVDVLYPPKIVNIEKIDDSGSEILKSSIPKLEIFNITKFSLICIVIGNPQPVTVWKKSGVILSRTNKLDFNLAQTGFSGSYSCSIQNELSIDDRVIELVEIGKPKLSPNFKSNHREKLGGRLSLDCPIQVDPKNKPVIVWYHNISRIHPSLVLNDRVKINKLDHVHNGKYRCEASTKAGTVVAEFNVDVLYPPKIVNIEKIDDFGSKILKPSITKLEIFNVTKFSLTCIVIGNPPPVTVWKKNGVILARSNKLNINLAQTGLSGLYSCSIENELSTDYRVIELFEIGKPKLSPNFKSNHREKLGGQLSLDCPIQVDPNSKPDIVWYHNTSRIQPSLVVNDRVKINKLDHVHNGKYRCEASTKAGTVVAEFNVDVLYPPKIVNIEKIDDFGSKILKPSITKLEIFNVTKFSLTCIVIGNPPPVTVWKKNGVIFSRTNKLNINLAKTGFSGSYTCSIQNQLSSDNRVIELVEIIKPKLSRYSNVQNLVENNEFRMICPVEPGDYDVKWFFNDNSIDQYKQADGSLLIKNVDTNMKGRAYCVATNKAGSVVASFNFDVLQPPFGLSTTTSSYKNRLHQIAPNKKQMTLVKDAPFDITCNAQGNPNPDIYWLKNDQMYFKGKLITIASIQSKDAATYTCIAENTLGKQVENISVIINVPPYLLSTSGLENSTNTNNINKLGVTVLIRVEVPDTYFKADYEQIIQINEGEKVSLECEMDGHPKPTVNWFKNNENLNKQTALLEFTSARIENSGIYKCVGDNTSGKEMSVIFYLNVQKPISIISATSTKPVYKVSDEIKLICKTKGNQLPKMVWRKGNFTDNEIIFKSNDSIRKQLLQQDEPLYLNGKKIIQVSDMAPLERYGKISYEFIDGEYIGTLEYIIKSAKFSDSGKYECKSRIYKIKNSDLVKSVKIEVVEAPSLEIAEETYSILEGINAHKIKCPITGMPPPSIEWYRENSILTSNQNLDVQNHFLEFKSPMLHHAGEYSCRGTNNGGSVEFKFKVIIFKHIADISNVVLNLSPKRGLEVEKNETEVLECSIKVTPTYWSRIIDAYPLKQRQLLAATETYTFYGNVSTDIMCSKDAEPEYGEIIQITVIEKPTIQSIETNIEVKLDDNLRLQCDATGEPKPTFKWYKYERGQQYDIDNYSGFVANGETLIKWRAENSDTTQYVCMAQNKLGEVSHTFNVTVLNDSHYVSTWSGWSTCTKTCGEGVQFRTRDCIHASCKQPQQREDQRCTIIECPVDGGWSDFSKFSDCSKTCVIDFVDIPIKQLKRECNKPVPAFGGQQCQGNSVLILNCTVPLCISVENTLVYPPGCLDQPICCPIGYEHDNRSGGCKEIDKCKRKGPYSACKSETQKCVNIGTDDYSCECKAGFRLKRRGKYNPKKPNCVDIDECKMEPKPCGSSKCDNTVGSYKCINSLI